MPGSFLTTASTILCPHGGQAILFSSQPQVTAGGAPVLIESDQHPIAGCPFTIGPKYSPCTRIQWIAGVARVTLGGVAPLVQSSVGLCLSPEGAPQGTAIIAATQPQASGS